MILILGAGLAGLSASYHLGHERCVLLERAEHPFGHIGSQSREGFRWDQGPHVSFTKDAYVRDLFERSVGPNFTEFEVKVGNYYHGHWIDHPAQTALHQLPEPERSRCLASFLETRQATAPAPGNYEEWLQQAFGPVFASSFPSVYTRKYWTRPASELTTDWIGRRILYPDVEDVKRGAEGPLQRQMHYISKVRYPRQGGYEAFAAKLRQGARIHFGTEAVSVDLRARVVYAANGSAYPFERLVNTLPLPVFVSMCHDLPASVRAAAARLTCTQLLLVNVAAPHPTRRPEHWMYVYDADKLSTRINCTEMLSASNAPAGWTGVQAEVYFSRHHPLPAGPDQVGEIVERELVEMGLIEPTSFGAGQTSHRHVRYVPWANVVFDHDTRPALDTILSWLEAHGLAREADDLHPLTDWSTAQSLPGDGALALAGRFGQWKYFWTDDCVLRGRQLSQSA